MRLISGQPARHLTLSTLAPLRRAIGAGYGPHGSACLLGTRDGTRALTTGCEIARHLTGREGAGNVAPRLLTEILVAADRDLGDGTARLAIILDATLRESTRCLDAGAEVNALSRALQQLAGRFGELLLATGGPPVSMAAAARTAGADENAAAAIARLATEIGPGAAIDVNESHEPGFSSHREQAYLFGAEGVSGRLAASGLDAPHILVANEAIDDFGSLAAVVEAFAVRGKALLIVARDVSGAALQTLIVNQASFRGRVAVLRPSAVSNEAAETLQDLAVATGATMVCSREGTRLESLRPSMLGSAGASRFERGVMRLTAPGGDPERVASRCVALRAEAAAKRFLALDRERLTRRVARLEGRWGELRVGTDGIDEVEPRIARLRRACASTVATMESGSLQGGAAGLAKALRQIEPSGTEAEKAAWRCLAAGVVALHYHLVQNAGGEPPSLTDPVGSLTRLSGSDLDARLCDPSSLTAAAFQRAASGAATMLLTDVILSN